MDKLDPLGESCLAQFHIWTKKQAVLGEISSCWIGPEDKVRMSDIHLRNSVKRLFTFSAFGDLGHFF